MKPTLTPDYVWTVVHGIVAEMVSRTGVRPEEIARGSRLQQDFGLSSMDVIHMMMSIEEQLGTDLQPEDLFAGRDAAMTDLSMAELHEFLCRQLHLPGTPGEASLD
jgi:acyl carrier protein